MPTASLARLEKQASLDANDPLKQGIVIIEHKIRNLEKRKVKLDGYRELQESGKVLNSDQLEAISKFDAVIAHLEFAKELSKQLQTLANDSAKTLKKQARKEAAERAQQELARTKELLIINDVLTSMGQQAVRDDLLSGKGKVSVTEEELQAIDDLYEELTPKKEEPMAFLDMFQTPAETMHHLMEGKNREAFGSTYSALKTKLMEIATSGYFDTAAPVPEVVETPEVIPEPEPEPVPEEALPPMEPVAEPPVQLSQIVPPQMQPQPIVPHTFQPNKGQPSMQVHPADVDSSIVTAIPAGQPIPGQTPQQIETAYFTPSHLRVFQSGTIDFMQENEIDTPENTEAAPSAIPTMTFANQSFSASEPPQLPHIPPAAHHIEIQQPYQNQTDEEKGWSTTGGNSIELEQPVAPVQQQQPVNAWTSLPTEQTPPQNLGGSGDDDWASQTEQWSQNQVNPAMSNDGFITAGSGRGRGGRGRGGGGGGDRNNKGGYSGSRGGGSRNSTGGRGGYRGEREGGYRGDREGGYNRDREGGYKDREGGGSYYKDQNNSGGYQNGYQSGRSSRGGGGAPRQSQDRQGGGGGRGGGGRGGRGGYRGGSGNPGGNYRQ
uniref:Caprin-1 n=3 Tax=Lygus hesperus TaxID=30085 RepID=A0A0A9W481_LYGHE